MERLASIASSKILRLFNENMPNWNKGKYTVTASSSTNVSYSSGVNLFDINDKELLISDKISFIPDTELENDLIKIFKSGNLDRRANKLVFYFINKKLLNIDLIWDQSVHDEFEQYLPKSKRGKVKAWYLPDGETTISPEPAKSFSEQMLSSQVARLPVEELSLHSEQLGSKRLEELYSLFNPYVQESNNPLWDSGLIRIKKDAQGQFSGELIQYYYENEDDRETGRSQYEQMALPVVTDRMKSIYDAIQSVTKRQYPGSEWDTVVVSISKDGFTEVNYELEGEEVEME